jgi:microcystin-dependent protein
LAWGHKNLQAQSFYTPLSNSLLNSIEDSLHHIDSEVFTTVKPYAVGTINTRIDNFNEKLKLEGRFASETWLGRKIFNEDLIQKHTTDFTGGDQPHNNMPPYLVLVYIMKL